MGDVFLSGNQGTAERECQAWEKTTENNTNILLILIILSLILIILKNSKRIKGGHNMKNYTRAYQRGRCQRSSRK